MEESQGESRRKNYSDKCHLHLLESMKHIYLEIHVFRQFHREDQF